MEQYLALLIDIIQIAVSAMIGTGGGYLLYRQKNKQWQVQFAREVEDRAIARWQSLAEGYHQQAERLIARVAVLESEADTLRERLRLTEQALNEAKADLIAEREQSRCLGEKVARLEAHQISGQGGDV